MGSNHHVVDAIPDKDTFERKPCLFLLRVDRAKQSIIPRHKPHIINRAIEREYNGNPQN
jgi:hypothetical protein